MFGFSIAMSLFEVQQIRNLIDKDEDADDQTKPLKDNLNLIT